MSKYYLKKFDSDEKFYFILVSKIEKIDQILYDSYERDCGIGKENYNYIMRFINKQQKEIEKLKFNNYMTSKWNEYLDKECISKDKIREKIKHYNNELEHIKNGEEFENEEPMYYWGKVTLEDLLEED